MERAERAVLSIVGALLCVSCVQTDVTPKDTENTNAEESFASGSVGDCSSWEVSTIGVPSAPFDGVDILVTVDNSAAMAEAQQRLSDGLFTLINTLTKPVYPALENVRLAVVSSDLGLSYGEGRETALSPTDIPGCEDTRGDDGAFLQILPELSNSSCPPLNAEFASTSFDSINSNLAEQAACMAVQGTSGCGFQQQLEAAVVGLERHREFIADTHLLVVLIVSDKDDSSIASPELFETAEWNDPALRNIAANAESENDSYLFSPERYRDIFIEMKQGSTSDVIFGAIVGVPTAAESAANGWAPCEGPGADITDCLHGNPAMTLKAVESLDSAGDSYTHFAPACVLEDATSGVRVTEASPGRRFVKAAQAMYDLSFVYSICNPDWSPAMTVIAERIALLSAPSDFPQKVDWHLSASQPPACENGDCGESPCDVVVQITRNVDDSEECPADLYTGLSDAAREGYLEKKIVEPVKIQNGQITLKNIYCHIPKLPTPKDCAAAEEMARTSYSDRGGWYYCENEVEDAEQTLTDAEDASGNHYLRITALGRKTVRGNFVFAQCLSQGALSETECKVPDNAALGTTCTQPGFEADDIWFRKTTGLDALSFQTGCDCMTAHNMAVNSHSPEPHTTIWVDYANFCTRPCNVEDNNCPVGFTCEPFPGRPYYLPEPVPESLSEAYCVPECVATPCVNADEHCAPATPNGDIWTCQLRDPDEHCTLSSRQENEYTDVWTCQSEG